jgi:hypothetical protein
MIRRFAKIFAAQPKTNEADRLTSQQKSDYMAFCVAAVKAAPYSHGEPGLDRARSRKKLLRILGVKDGTALSLRLLRGALQSRDAGDVEIAVGLSAEYGLTPEHVAPLVQLVSADWHRSHENILSALDRLRAPEAVDALFHATQWVPDYLAFDDARAMARKAIYALGKTAGSDAEQALKRLVDIDDEFLRETVTHVLEIRSELLLRQPPA